MLRLAKKPLTIPKNIDLNVKNNELFFKGSNGNQSFTINDLITVKYEDDALQFQAKDNSKKSKAMLGTTIALIRNIMKGVTTGFEKKLILKGVGYRAQLQGNQLNLTLGLSHPVLFHIPSDITIELPSQTEIVVKGMSKERVGQIAANIRRNRLHNTNKGKGIRYADEIIKLKDTKKK